MGEQAVATGNSAVYLYGDVGWTPADGGISSLGLYYSEIGYRIVGLDAANGSVTINAMLYQNMIYQKASDTFYQFQDGDGNVYGLNFSTHEEAATFAEQTEEALKVIAGAEDNSTAEAEKQKEEEEKKKQAEDEKKKKTEEDKKRKAEEDRKKKAEEDRKKKAEEDRKKKEEEDRKRKAEEERKRKEEDERKRREEEERQRQEEAQAKAQAKPAAAKGKPAPASVKGRLQPSGSGTEFDNFKEEMVSAFRAELAKWKEDLINEIKSGK